MFVVDVAVFVAVEFVDSAGVASVVFEAVVNCCEAVEFNKSWEIASSNSLLPPVFDASVVVVFVELAAFSS